MKENIIAEKSYRFAIEIIEVYKRLSQDKREFVLSKQLLRSRTSIGANIEEAIGGISKKDFVAKMQISYKETRESRYWLRLLHDSGFLSTNDYEKLLSSCDELLRIISAILKSSKKE
ncbi:MAG TPA: four helix bundle protein [Bacteroidales bacterium]